MNNATATPSIGIPKMIPIIVNETANPEKANNTEVSNATIRTTQLASVILFLSSALLTTILA